MHFFADAMADVISDDAEMAFFEDFFYGGADISDVGAGFYLINAGLEGFGGGAEELADGGAGGFVSANDHGEGAVGIVSLVEDDEVKGGFVAGLEDVVGIGGAMDEFVIDGDADGTRERGVGEEVIGDAGTAGGDLVADPGVYGFFGHTRGDVGF